MPPIMIFNSAAEWREQFAVKAALPFRRNATASATIPLGKAAITGGGKLKAKYVIHAASMQLGGRTTAETLEASTRNSLLRAEEKKVAFPAIGTGIAGFDTRRCAEIMLRTVAAHLNGPTSLERVLFVLFDEPTRKVFEETWKNMQSDAKP